MLFRSRTRENSSAWASEYLDVISHGFFILGQMAALHESLGRDGSIEGVRKLRTSMRDLLIRLKAGYPYIAPKLSAGRLDADQLYRELFSADDHLSPVFINAPAKDSGR